jgi:hypothetical protein
MTITGATERTNQIRQSFAVSHWLDYEPTFAEATWGITLWEWHKSYFYSGGNQRADVGGKVLS